MNIINIMFWYNQLGVLTHNGCVSDFIKKILNIFNMYLVGNVLLMTQCLAYTKATKDCVGENVNDHKTKINKNRNKSNINNPDDRSITSSTLRCLFTQNTTESRNEIRQSITQFFYKQHKLTDKRYKYVRADTH